MTGTYRIELDGMSEPESQLFAYAFDELVSPIGDPRCLIPRYVVTSTGIRAASRLASGGGLDNAVVCHAVPTPLGKTGDGQTHSSEH